MNLSTYQTGKINQVITPSKINTKKTPASKIMAQKTIIEDEEMEQPEEIETTQEETKIEARYVETKERENTNTKTRRANIGKRIESF